MKVFYLFVIALLVNFMTACTQQSSSPTKAETDANAQQGKPVVYQVFTRLFGNTNTTNKPWGTIEENGVGKFNDFTDVALEGIKELGVTHIWYTGVPHHALIGDYTEVGISNDDPDVVKGRAGSPYAVKDYYSVNPDLAVDPAKRLEEFQALIARTHKHDMKVIIDIVPNHVARHYESLQKPEGVEDFGARDKTDLEYHRDNNFYYVQGNAFSVPEPLNGYQPLGGEAHPLSDGKFHEYPAKWTGNGSRAAQPHFHDWYETVKINYGVDPDGNYNFVRLPADFAQQDYRAHANFWAEKSVPDSWIKFRDITHYWLDMGVDGFRFDMAEMVPVEFWSYLNSSIKMKNPDAFLLAEVYNPAEYRNYIKLGKMDYLYDKVELYDTLKTIIQGTGSTDSLPAIQQGLADIEEHMLHFLENHDEQRIASPEFAGAAEKAKPAMVVSALISRSPTMIYFGQEVGEAGAIDSGFGDPSRTSIFDYAGVPAHQRWMNHGKFDGGGLAAEEQALRDFYRRLLNLSATNPALMGHYQELHSVNRQSTEGYGEQVFAFARWQAHTTDDGGHSHQGNHTQKLVVVSNFSAEVDQTFVLQIPAELIAQWRLNDGDYRLSDQLLDQRQPEAPAQVLSVRNQQGSISLQLAPLQSVVLGF
jgi:glycosidase